MQDPLSNPMAVEGIKCPHPFHLYYASDSEEDIDPGDCAPPDVCAKVRDYVMMNYMMTSFLFCFSELTLQPTLYVYHTLIVQESPPLMPTQIFLARGFLPSEHVTSKLALAVKLDKCCHDSFEGLTIVPHLHLNYLEEKIASLDKRHRNGDFHNSGTSIHWIYDCFS